MFIGKIYQKTSFSAPIGLN